MTGRLRHNLLAKLYEPPQAGAIFVHLLVKLKNLSLIFYAPKGALVAYSNRTVLSTFFSPSVRSSVRLNLNGSNYTGTLFYCNYRYNVGLVLFFSVDQIQNMKCPLMQILGGNLRFKGLANLQKHFWNSS